MTSEEPVAFFLVSFVRMRRNRRIHPPNSSAVPLCYSVLLRRLHFWPRLTPILCVSVEQHFLSCWSLLFVFFSLSLSLQRDVSALKPNLVL